PTALTTRNVWTPDGKIFSFYFSEFGQLSLARAMENWKNTALLVIDMQKDFVTPGSPVCVNGSQSIVPSVIKAVDIARLRGILVVWVFSPLISSISLP
ncbi:hypothetical protein C5167_019676, partial [Papaver somniferum]